jgi:non-specific serine/threonine protein kinase
LDFDAFQLLVDRATTAAPDLSLGDDDMTPLLSICRRLDGLPLAIELVAARLRVLSPTEVESRLSDRFSLLGESALSGSGRHDNLDSLVQWSFDLLTPEEQTLFTRLAVFAGSFTLRAVEEVCSGDGLTVEGISTLLSGLADRSLVTRTEILAGTSRYRLLETLRIFALRHLLAGAPAATTVSQRHGSYFLRQAEVQGASVRGPDWSATIEVCDREIDDQRTALEWFLDRGDGDAAARLATALWPYWLRVRPTGEARTWIERARCLGPSDRVRMPLLAAAAAAAFAADDLNAALAATDEGLELARLYGQNAGGPAFWP